MNYLEKKYLNDFTLNTKAAKNSISNLLGSRPLAMSMKSVFPNIKEDYCNIVGSSELIELFEEINSTKFDITAQNKDVNFIEFRQDEIVLEIVQDKTSHIGTGIYVFTDDFLDKFKLDAHKKYCFKNELNYLIDNNLRECMNKNPSDSYQYRMINHNGETLIRAITSNRYKNYDNHIVLYIVLNSLHQYSQDTSTLFEVESGLVTDSSLNINFMSTKQKNLGDGWRINTGVKVQNNEIGEGSFSVEFVYKLSKIDEDSGEVYHFHAIADTIVKIGHIYTVEKISEQLKNFQNLDSITSSMIENAKEINSVNSLDKDQVYKIFKKFSDNRSMSPNSREIIKREQKQIIANTHSLIEIFGKVSLLITSIDEKTHLERLLHDMLTGMLK